MSAALPNLWTDVRARLLADTGTGGLFNVSTPLVAGLWLVNAPDSQAMPFLVMSSQALRNDDTFTSRHHVVEFQVSSFIEEEPATGYDPFARGASIAGRVLGDWSLQGTRLPSFGLDRWTPALSGSGWSASPVEFVTTREQHTPGVVQFVHEFVVRLSQG